jgi:hypothetical protein
MHEIRDNWDDADSLRQELELLQWTRALLTGFDMIKGQGDPFLAGRYGLRSSRSAACRLLRVGLSSSAPHAALPTA